MPNARVSPRAAVDVSILEIGWLVVACVSAKRVYPYSLSPNPPPLLRARLMQVRNAMQCACVVILMAHSHDPVFGLVPDVYFPDSQSLQLVLFGVSV